MVKTIRNGGSNKINKRASTKRNHKYQSFEQEITIKFMEMLIAVKLFHWKTYSYATHKATDELYGKLNEHIDHFIEVLLGKTGERINLTSQKTLPLLDLTTQKNLIMKVEQFKSYLVGLNMNKTMMLMSNSDLLNIRDEILGDMNQFLYLLSFRL